MSIDRYVMRPIAKDVVEFDGTYESACEIAHWMASEYPDEMTTLTLMNLENPLDGTRIQNVTLTVHSIGMFGIPQDIPVLMWGFVDEGEKGKPITMHTEGSGNGAYPGYFVVKNADKTFVALRPEKFHELYRKQKTK